MSGCAHRPHHHSVGGVEGTQGSFNWGQVDTVVGAANAATCGSSARSSRHRHGPWRRALSAARRPPAAYGDFAPAPSRPCRGRVDYCYENWNEPNSVLDLRPARPAVYADMLKASYPKIKAADRGAVVIGGVVTAVVSFFALTMDPVTFVQKIYAAGAGGSFDALSFHPYHYNLSSPPAPGSPAAAQPGRRHPPGHGGQR